MDNLKRGQTGSVSLAKICSRKALSGFVNRRYGVQMRRFQIWRKGYEFYLDIDAGKVVIERNGAVDQKIDFGDVQSISKDHKTIFVHDKNRKEHAFRPVDEKSLGSLYVALRGIILEANDLYRLETQISDASKKFDDIDADDNGNLKLWQVKSVVEATSYDQENLEVSALLKRKGLNDDSTVSKEEFLVALGDYLQRNLVLSAVFQTYAKKDGVMQTDELEEFLRNEQKESAEDASVAAAATLREFSQEGAVFTADEFLEFLQSELNSALNPAHNDLYMDMTQPLCDYFIASSHNTYLEGNQLIGNVSVDMYVKTLQAGARCVEIDIWDDEDGEPIVTHGHTLTGECKFRDVVDAFAEDSAAFACSDYPLILSFEDHLTLNSRLRMVSIMKENSSFWSMLCKPEEGGARETLSPEALRGKILIKMKIKKETPPSLARLILIPGGKHKGSWPESMSKPALTCFSFDEGRVQQFVEENEGPDLVKYNESHLTRVYPSQKRVQSSNFDPSLGWTYGCQLVALNYQTMDQWWTLNRAMFARNGGVGYLLRTPRLRGAAPLDTQTVVEIRLLYGQHITDPETESYISVKATCGRTANPDDKFQTPKQLYGGATVVLPHAAQPDLPSYCFEIQSKELSSIIFKVKRQPKSNRINAQRSQNAYFAALPVESLRQGYRVVPLVDPMDGEVQPYSVHLFCHFIVKDG